MDLSAGATVGDYRIGSILGRGASGVVYKALNVNTGAIVAIKSISLESCSEEEVEKQMMEISMLKELDHENIVRYYDCLRNGRTLFVIMDYSEGGSLQHTVQQFGPLLPDLVAVYVSQLLEGLQYLHSHNVVHRDIKGANVLLTKDGFVQLSDFGVATQAEGSNSVVGTPYWMAPEIISMSGTLPASDIWSVGCTVIELLTGHPPYHGLNTMAALYKIVEDDHPPLPEGLSPAMIDFLTKCFTKDPKERPSATELLTHPMMAKANETNFVKREARASTFAAVDAHRRSVSGLDTGAPRPSVIGGGGGAGGRPSPLSTTSDPTPAPVSTGPVVDPENPHTWTGKEVRDWCVKMELAKVADALDAKSISTGKALLALSIDELEDSLGLSYAIAMDFADALEELQEDAEGKPVPEDPPVVTDAPSSSAPAAASTPMSEPSPRERVSSFADVQETSVTVSTINSPANRVRSPLSPAPQATPSSAPATTTTKAAEALPPPPPPATSSIEGEQGSSNASEALPPPPPPLDSDESTKEAPAPATDNGLKRLDAVQPVAIPQPSRAPPQPVSSSQPVCGRCTLAITSQGLTALNKQFHPDCFTCRKCEKCLLGVSFNAHEDEPYCQECYQDLFAPKCARCNLALSGSVFTVSGQKYHQDCFTCKECGASLQAGYFEQPGTGDLVCSAHAGGVTASPDDPCPICQQPITGGNAASIGGKLHHRECLVCAVCDKALDGMFVSDGNGKYRCTDCNLPPPPPPPAST